MSQFVINGPNKLNGSIEIECSKNSLLPIIAASALSSNTVTLKKVPQFSDITNMLKIIEDLGAIVDISGDTVVIDPTQISSTSLSKQLAGSLRASVLFLGALIAKFGKASTFMPGGCNIGARPIDLHIKGFEALGVTCTYNQDKLLCSGHKITGRQIILPMPSVGATENLVMAASLANGQTTTIVGAAAEPEIEDLCNFINAMGGNISGGGTNVITIKGVASLDGTTYTAIPDRIVTGTYLVAVAMCGGEVCLKGTCQLHNKIIITNLSNLGCQIACEGDNIYISSRAKLCANALGDGQGISLTTQGYPGFATDMQSQVMSMLSLVPGTHKITEQLFENRFNHAVDLNKLGASISVDGNTATIVGQPNCYHGGFVSACDLRGGAALVLASLAARGTTIVDNIHYIDRGYLRLDKKLASLGADIRRVE